MINQKETKKITQIWVTPELKKYLLQTKLDNNHKSIEETIWAFIGYDGERDGDKESATPSHTQETPCKTLHDTQEAIRANSSSGVSSNSK